MRLSLLGASAALIAALALSACSNAGSSSTLPSSGAQALASQHGVSTHIAHGAKQMISGCDYSVYAFCIYVTPGDVGPYVETEAGSGELYNNAWIVKNKNKKGKPDKKFDTYFYPDPGNPTYQYIDYKGKNPKATTAVKFTDYYCIGESPSACSPGTYTFKIGIALQPAT